MSASPAATPRPGQPTHVASGSKLTGEISGSPDLVVDGEIEGRIHLDNGVVVNQGGLVHGEIQARTVRIGGRVIGNVVGREMIEISSEGSVEGDVTSPRVVIADGAFFKGKVEMTGGQAPAAGQTTLGR